MEYTNNAKLEYQKLVERVSPDSKLLTNCVRAFLGGGFICLLAQGLLNVLLARGIEMDNARLAVAIALIAAAIILTGLGWYDNLTNWLMAGASVPITGFANAIAAPAIEYKKEGYILGIGAKMFLIAGPVVLYGTLTSVLVGIIYYFVR